MKSLRIAAAVELASLVVLLANLATVHWPPLSSLIGPTHGCAYLFVVLATLRHSGATTPIKLTALAPGIGGLLVLRQLTRRQLSTAD
ncbi:DUF3817 domain-containing protein [Saccharothrix coeruleofusca]|uniref:Uncharacterized protein n=1 Tax=Saccharothrix coeruleofusca TaxID=33919 RepID=A0A918ALR1_9PSEU|nr:DUF3817 domain-containing protein [Saccharothrix coeruleofusca]MBP2336114.1 hypothetical protein [Saccharothrix coeruleofusca]GGP55321.1 hypothetical protein GCM10010185_29860 [Saccharothrix coeruleofusca]